MECLERINSIDHDTKATGKIEAGNECKTTTTDHRRGKLLCLCVFRRGCFELFCSLKKLKVWPPNGVAGMRSRRTEGGDRCDTLRFSTNKPASAEPQLYKLYSTTTQDSVIVLALVVVLVVPASDPRSAL